MSEHLTFKKGLDINLSGEANRVIVEVSRSKRYGINLSDFHGIIPKMTLKEGDVLKAGEVIFHAKNNPTIKFVSPVSGVLSTIQRGAKRRIEQVIIDANSKDTFVKHEVKDYSSWSADQIKQLLLDSGCWSFIKQRPYDIIADTDKVPKAIFISAHATAPLSAKPEFYLKNDIENLQKGIDVLAKLTSGSIHFCTDNSYPEPFSNIKGADLHCVSGGHPSGNVSFQIRAIDALNQGEIVWTISPRDIVVIGKLFSEGIVDMTRIVAISGSEAEHTHYVKIKSGATIADFIGLVKDNVRIISGDVLTGSKVPSDGFVGHYHDTVTIIPEGNHHRMLGWVPFKDNHIPSFYNTSLFKLKSKPTVVDTNLNGEERAIVVTGQMEKVMPIDIYPMQLIKACLANNIERMEGLGIYEVAPEDFALIDYISTSKIEAQEIIREGLDLMIREVG